MILIGDAPAKSKESIIEYRNNFKGEPYWKESKFGERTHYIDELQKLKNSEIPVHAFYLNKGARNNFEEIARETKG